MNTSSSPRYVSVVAALTLAITTGAAGFYFMPQDSVTRAAIMGQHAPAKISVAKKTGGKNKGGSTSSTPKTCQAYENGHWVTKPYNKCFGGVQVIPN